LQKIKPWEVEKIEVKGGKARPDHKLNWKNALRKKKKAHKMMKDAKTRNGPKFVPQVWKRVGSKRKKKREPAKRARRINRFGEGDDFGR